MNFGDAEKILESGKKEPRKTLRIILVALLSVAVIAAVGTFFSETIKQIFSPTNENHETISTTQQSTMGNQSPTIYSKGDVIVMYGLEDFRKWNQMTKEMLKNTPEDKKYTEQEVRDKIAKIYQKLYDTLPQEAEERASQFLSTFPLRQEQLIDNQKRQRDFLQALPNNLSETFKYIIYYIDSYTTELGNKSGMMTLTKEADIGPVIVSSGRPGHVVRTIHFTNPKFIKITFMPGVIADKKITKYPSLAFQGYFLEGKAIEGGEFKVWRMAGSGFGGGWEVQYEQDGTMNESAKKHFKDEFDKFLDRVIASTD